MRYPRLLIRHNHGALLLAHATIVDGLARGTVVYGHSTSRLFWATSTQRDTPGTEGTFMVYGRTPRHVAHTGFAQDGRWCESPTPGDFEVSCEYCG